MSKFLNIVRSLAMLASVAVLGSPLASAQLIGKADLKKLIGTAGTPQDHERIAKHFDSKAVQYEADAKYHEELAAVYTAAPTGHEQKHPMSGLTAGHCKFFAKEAHLAAEEARKIAAAHREMAKPKK